MFRNIIFSLFFILTMLDANSIESEIGINIGLNSTKNEDGNKFKNPSIGLFYQNNRYVVSPRVDLDYTKVKNDYAEGLLKASINGVYEYENSTYTTPYALAGVGYEYVRGETEDVFESRPFVQGGAGVKIELDQGFKARFEGKVLQVIGGNNEDNEFMLTAGVSMPINANARKELKQPSTQVVPRPRVVTPIRDIRPVVRQPQYVPPRVTQPRVPPMSNNRDECPIKISAPDFDRDGIANSVDQCPSTPCNFSVDAYGCPVKTTLKINFPSGSAEVGSEAQIRIRNFAQFLLNSKGSMVNITGHTDSRGTASRNLRLSHQRANAVVHFLSTYGVSPARLQAFGKGESMPLASNTTANGRAKNRRIEAELFYPKGR
ncbi:MAG: Outer membrane protein [uncultured Sulfurovum sp.]|uniref:Outer membrane protein n=1 Tax=uncultured Sulfurovum sp. TaxID=269237 RepID=A0A6S6U6Q0_9BACT|nr:MAG: Outer membrane protein [uncultured Sulfurovum sp.]